MKTLGDKLRNWYANGEKGLNTIAQTEDLDTIKREVEHWFASGHKVMDELCEELDQWPTR